MKNLYKLDNINLNYDVNGNNIRVLKNINFEIKKNERVAIIGESGSGKTSLLMLMSGLEKPTEGSIFFQNQDLFHMHSFLVILQYLFGHSKES